ncbi:hypothetical protein [Microbulbifer taiwanensis]|uniref:Uncharacterized protein n=1 Tax=Microbulbifer taiwanensis TaxID=986746 RepID=A0ABW1YVG8_9GAMM|nr:hypothetical protein [Microbulbifer taiwanensis]
MINQPSKPVSRVTTVALTYFREELQPVLSELHELSVKLSGFKVGFFESITRNRIRDLEADYANLMNRFMATYKKWYLPEEMFNGTGVELTTEAYSEYHGLKSAFTEHIQEGFRLISFADRLVGGARSIADNRVAITVSISAITVSVIIAIFQVASS